MFQFQLTQSQWWTVSWFIIVKGESDLGIFCVISECAAWINKHHRRKYNFLLMLGLYFFCFLSTTIPMFRFWPMIQMGPIFFSNLIFRNTKTRAVRIRYVLTKLRWCQDTKVHLQVSPYPSCWWTTVSIARALKGGTEKFAQEKTAPCGKEIYLLDSPSDVGWFESNTQTKRKSTKGP